MKTGIAPRRKERKGTRLLGALCAFARAFIVLAVLLSAPAAQAQRLSAQPPVTNLAPTALFDVSVLTNATRYQSRAISLSNLTANVVSNGVRITAGTNVSSIQTNRTGGYLEFTINTTDAGGSGSIFTNIHQMIVSNPPTVASNIARMLEVTTTSNALQTQLTVNSNGWIAGSNALVTALANLYQTPWTNNIDAATYNLNSLGTIRWAAKNGNFLAYLTNDGDSGIYSPTDTAGGGFWLSSDGYSNAVFAGGVVDLRRVRAITLLNGTQYTTNGNVLAHDANGNVYSTAMTASGGGNVSATNNGASGEIAIYGGSAKMIAFTNTITANVSLAGAQTNAPLAFGQDGYATNGGFIADQFGTNLATAAVGPSYYIKSGALVTNPVIDAGRITNAVVVSNAGFLNVTNGGAINASHGTMNVPASITFSNSTTKIERGTDTAVYISPSGTRRMALSGNTGSGIFFNNTINGTAGIYFNATTLDANATALGGSGNNGMFTTTIETNGHRAWMLGATNLATHGGTNIVQFTTQITNAAAGANTTNLVIYYMEGGVMKRGTIPVNIP